MGMKDVIKVQVFNDGDCELTRLEGVPAGPSGVRYLYFPIAEISRLNEELQSYGHDPDRAKEAVDAVLVAGYNEPVKV
jgi:hypothetical protein